MGEQPCVLLLPVSWQIPQLPVLPDTTPCFNINRDHIGDGDCFRRRGLRSCNSLVTDERVVSRKVGTEFCLETQRTPGARAPQFDDFGQRYFAFSFVFLFLFCFLVCSCSPSPVLHCHFDKASDLKIGSDTVSPVVRFCRSPTCCGRFP